MRSRSLTFPRQLPLITASALTIRTMYLPAITSRFALKSYEQSVSRWHEIVFLHRLRKRITKCFDDLGIVRPGSIVEGKRFSTVAFYRFNRRFYPVYSETEKECADMLLLYKCTTKRSLAKREAQLHRSWCVWNFKRCWFLFYFRLATNLTFSLSLSLSLSLI